VASAAIASAATAIDELDIQAELDRLGTVELPPGEIFIHRGLVLPSRTILRGSGWDTVLRPAPGLRAPIIRLAQPHGAAAEKEIQGCGIESLSIVGGGTQTGIDYGADRAVRGSNPRSCWIRGVRIENCLAGIAVDYAEGGHITECKLIYNNTGIFVGDAASGMQVTHCDFRHNVTGLRVKATQPSNEWLVSGCHFESNTGTAVSIAGAQCWTFLRCKWEGNGAHVLLDWPGGGNVSLRPDGHQFIAATFNKTAAGAPGFSANSATYLHLQGCAASPALGVALSFRAGFGATLTGCMIRARQVVGLPPGSVAMPVGLLP
jgi:hypothetical protein